MKQRAKVVSDSFIEIEKKFLISDMDLSRLPDHREISIEEVFLLSSQTHLDQRIRTERCQGKLRYYLVEKYVTTQPAIGFKRREEIGRRRFDVLRSSVDRDRTPLRKQRWEFMWNSMRFRIDKYDGPFEGLLILRAVLKHEDKEMQVPGFCTVLREVTGEVEYYWPNREESAERPATPVRRKESNTNFHIVALVDLLGQGQKLDRFAGIPRTPKERRAFTRLNRATFGTVDRFRERVRTLNRVLPKAHAIPDMVRESLTPGQVRLAERNVEPPIDLQFFTDLALLKINLGGQKGHLPLMSLHSLLRQLGLLMLTELAEGVLFRGAIEAGICAELGGNDLYGQAISRAHALESTIAVYPRIVVGAHLTDYVASFAEKRQSESERAISDSYARLIGVCLRPDDDGVLTFSYLEPSFRQSYFGDESDLWYVVKSACRAIRRHQDLPGDEQLRERVTRVEEYFKREGCWVEPQRKGATSHTMQRT
jgi:CYTH domain-containing protein